VCPSRQDWHIERSFDWARAVKAPTRSPLISPLFSTDCVAGQAGPRVAEIGTSDEDDLRPPNSQYERSQATMQQLWVLRRLTVTEEAGSIRSLLSGEPRRHPSSQAQLHPMDPLNPLLRSKVGDVRALPARDPVDPGAPVDLVQRRVLPVGRVRPSWLATSLLRSKSRPPRCRGGRDRTPLRT
jgi:hypothetical protein